MKRAITGLDEGRFKPHILYEANIGRRDKFRFHIRVRAGLYCSIVSPTPTLVDMQVALDRMKQRYEIDRDDSDVAAFYALLYFGELVSKLLVSGLHSAVPEDRDRSRYGISHTLVRADGIGEWASALDQLLIGPASQLLDEALRPSHRQLTTRPAPGSWERKALEDLAAAAKLMGVEDVRLNDSTPLRQWFHWFAALRNKTRGHGAPLPKECHSAAPLLESSIKSLATHLDLWRMPCAFLHRNLSGKFRVSMIGGDSAPFEHLKSTPGVNLSSGLFLFSPPSRSWLQVELVFTDADLTDFEVPNGQFRGKEFETISYITNSRSRRDGSHLLSTPQALPASATQGRLALEVQGTLLANFPPAPADYVTRAHLEDRLAAMLASERHEVVTLAGPGGAGKTSLALQVLWNLARRTDSRFSSGVWFSARDIDLLPSGPKEVRPHGVLLDDFAREYVSLMEPQERLTKGFKPATYLAESLGKGPLGPTLFVFDNFETVSNPSELFRWIDTYIRAPNKVLITTRTRDFVGDYPIEVLGMTDSEARELISTTAQRLGITGLLTSAYIAELVAESGGHPYVLKILLGEVRNAGRAAKPERIVADQEHILVALFERTYSTLSPSAQRVFLLLSRWRSAVPVLALEAVSLRSAEERLDIRAALLELTRFSLVEEWGTPGSDETFVSVPLAAMRFGQKKLNASPWKATIELDFQLLQLFGAASRAESQSGVLPRIHRLLSALAREVAAGKTDLHAHQAMLSFIGARAPASLPEIARLFVEEGSDSGRKIAIDHLRQYIESGDPSLPPADVWQQIVSLSRAAGDSVNELRALTELATARGVGAQQVSRAAFGVSFLLTEARKEGRSLVDNDERRLLLSAISRSLESLLDDLNATDLSRLAWIHLSLGNEARARDVVALGVKLEPENSHCRSLALRLGVPLP